MIITTENEIRDTVLRAKQNGLTVGFVPTMGALHSGHSRLISTANMHCDFVVVSVFVNPTQFGPNEDFAKYPRSIDSDRQIAEQAGARVIFHPNMSVIYPRKYGISLSLPDVASRWESDFRPTHFAGVMGVCLRLFNLVTPDAVFFGQKDLQQLRVIETMVQDLRLGIRVVPIRTVRDKDGLAMSSRNAYLSPEQRTLALVIREALTLGRAKIIEGNNSVQEIESAMCEIILAKNGLTIDYLNIVHSQTLEPAITLRGELAIIAAVRVGGTRLIDNEILTV